MSKFYALPPQNIKEAFVSAIPNCTTMLLGMMTLNLWIYGHLTWENFLSALAPMYLTAFCLDFFIVGPFVMRIVKKFQIMKFMPLIRVGMMAAILTCVAPVIETGYLPGTQQYLMALPRNYIVALLLQVLVAYRFGVFVLARYRQSREKVNLVK